MRKPYKQNETARLHEFLRAADSETVRNQSVAKLIKKLGLKLSVDYTRKLINQYFKDREEAMQQGKQAESLTAEAALEQIAAVVSKTHAHAGDNELVGSEDGNLLVVRIIRKYDPALLERGLRMRLPK